MKVILSGGGTGGHIYPALTIADQIKAIRPDVEITFVGTRQGLEKILFHVTVIIWNLLMLQVLNAV